MEDLPGEVLVDAAAIVEHLRSLAESLPGSYPRHWVPQATFDELQIRADREPVHLNPSLHHLHHRWDLKYTRTVPTGHWNPKERLRRFVIGVVYNALEKYFVEEQDFRAATAQSIDAVAYRVDEVASADLRTLFDLVRADLLDLARYVDDRLDGRDSEQGPLRGGTGPDRPA